MFPETIETERLRLRRLSRELVDPLSAYEAYAPEHAGTEAAFDYVPFELHDTPKDTVDFLADAERRWDEGEGATYAVLPDDDPADDGGPTVEGRPYAGTAGLLPRWDRRLAELGVFLREPFWGRGYSGERAAALLDLAFDGLGLDVVAVACVVDNEQSVRAIETYVDRFGGRRDGTVRNAYVVGDDPVDAHRYSIAADEWRAAVADDRPSVTYGSDD